jgi:hypothetical protein
MKRSPCCKLVISMGISVSCLGGFPCGVCNGYESLNRDGYEGVG